MLQADWSAAMLYEFYDRAGNLLGESREPGGRAIKRDEEIPLRFSVLSATRWKVIAVSEPVGGVQKVTVRPI